MTAAAALAAQLVLAANGVAGAGAAPAGGAAGSRIQAFLLASAPDSFADFQAHAAQVGVLYPTFFQCSRSGASILGAGVPAISEFAHANGIPVWPRFNCQQGATVHAILTRQRLRARIIAGLVQIAKSPEYGGLNLDLENDGPSDRAAFTSFVAALAARLHRMGRRLAVDVAGVTAEDPTASTGFYDERALGRLADSVFVMAWGTHWAGSGPGPIAPLPYVEAVARYVSSLPDARRFVLGIPMYGLDWAVQEGAEIGARAYQYAQIVALARRVGAVPRRQAAAGELTFSYTGPEGLVHTVWYLDAASVEQRARIARRLGLGVGLWRLGSEAQALWTSPALT